MNVINIIAEIYSSKIKFIREPKELLNLVTAEFTK